MFFVAALMISLAAYAEPDLSGIWMLDGRVTESEVRLTAAALKIQADYDLLSDDPSLYCEPASTSRVWANPNVRIAFDQSADRVLISYEFYDLRRDIPIGERGDISMLSQHQERRRRVLFKNGFVHRLVRRRQYVY